MILRSLVRFIIFAFFLFILFRCGQQQEDKVAIPGHDVEKKQYTREIPPEPGIKKEPTLIYDTKGNIIERHGYSYKKKDTSIRSKDSYYYSYDDSNNVVTEIKESYDLNGKRKFKNVNHYKYNHRNLKIDLEFESFDAQDVRTHRAHHSFRYNEQGHKVEDISYSEDNGVISRIILDPDKSGALRSEEYLEYDDNGGIKSHKKYFYSANGLDKTVDLLKDK